MRELTSTDAVIEALGGTGKVARRFGWSKQKVSNWRHQVTTFPAHTFENLQGGLIDIGYIGASTLWPQIPESIQQRAFARRTGRRSRERSKIRRLVASERTEDLCMSGAPVV